MGRANRQLVFVVSYVHEEEGDTQDPLRQFMIGFTEFFPAGEIIEWLSGRAGACRVSSFEVKVQWWNVESGQAKLC